MVTGRDVLVQREYYREQVRIAERARLARRTKMRGDLVLRMHGLLSWLGIRLVSLGRRLEEQYEAVVSGKAIVSGEAKVSGEVVISPPPAQPAVGQ